MRRVVDLSSSGRDCSPFSLNGEESMEIDERVTLHKKKKEE